MEEWTRTILLTQPPNQPQMDQRSQCKTRNVETVRGERPGLCSKLRELDKGIWEGSCVTQEIRPTINIWELMNSFFCTVKDWLKSIEWSSSLHNERKSVPAIQLIGD